MKTNKLYFLKLSVIAIAAFITITSCEDDNDSSPKYVGTWVATDKISDGEVTIEVKDEITFTSKGFEQLGQIKDPETDEWVDFLSMEASISVSGNSMDVTIEEIGMSDFDEYTGFPTGDITTYTEDDDEFSELLEALDMEETFEAEYSITDDKMTLKADSNNDGDFDDDEEVKKYKKQ